MYLIHMPVIFVISFVKVRSLRQVSFMMGQGFVFSLRSEEGGLDVSEIAKKFGGGGHKHSAGFKVKNIFTLEEK